MLCFIISRKVKTRLKRKKWFVQCMEKVLWLIERVKSGLQSFMLEISRWTMLHSRAVEVDSDLFETLIENHQRYTMQETADILKISKSSAENHLHQLSYVNCFDVWAPHKLSEENLLDLISTCDSLSLLKPNENVPFLKQTVTGDEKWILYNNVEWKRSWGKWNEPPPTTPKASLHPKEVMLCIWWDWKGVLYYELLPENQMINSNKYCSQLDQLKVALDEKRPELVNRKCIIFHQGNAKPHVSLMTRQKLLQLGWEILIQLPYSPDIATSDFHLFWALQNSLIGNKFNSLEDCKRHLE